MKVENKTITLYLAPIKDEKFGTEEQNTTAIAFNDEFCCFVSNLAHQTRDCHEVLDDNSVFEGLLTIWNDEFLSYALEDPRRIIESAQFPIFGKYELDLENVERIGQYESNKIFMMKYQMLQESNDA